jgi:hypothetical protein
MARTRRSEPGFQAPGVPVREHVMVDESIWAYFHKEWRRIDREWRGAVTVGNAQLVLAEGSYTKLESSGFLEGVAQGVRAARAELRAEVRRMAKDFPGAYLVPV